MSLLSVHCTLLIFSVKAEDMFPRSLLERRCETLNCILQSDFQFHVESFMLSPYNFLAFYLSELLQMCLYPRFLQTTNRILAMFTEDY